MALHKDFPKDPFTLLKPEIRWFPADEDLRDNASKLLPPLVTKIRQEVFGWRQAGYPDISDTSLALLKFWFQTEHILPEADGSANKFQFYFAQQEAIETIIYLYEVIKIEDPYSLMRFDESEMVTARMFAEDWRRLVIKMATGTGKTKILALSLVWSYFHKLYEADSSLARNFLVIAPNIIVLERIRKDFDGLQVFFQDPMLPDNGYHDRNWREDFQLDLHIQDDVRISQKTGNIFLTNIHRVYDKQDTEASFEDEDTTDYFLGKKPVGKTNDGGADLGAIVRDIDELVILNDEAHHIHDEKLAWFKSIEDISNRLRQKGSQLSLQIDVTATPKDRNGRIFVQTVCDYPLVEAIHQNVVKHPVLPDEPSRAKLREHQSTKFTEKYADYIDLGYREWEKVYHEQLKNNKKAVLFVMTDDTANCDDLAEHLEQLYPILKNRVLTIHTNRSGDISESTSGKKKQELDRLRVAANTIDNMDNPYLAIVSVLMLKEGWDVKNVSTVVGLRSFSSKAKILPEQTLGRGLRRMYSRDELEEEYVSVVGTEAFLDFVAEIKHQGVELEEIRMDKNSQPKMPIVIEVDQDNKHKDIDKLDIEIPKLTPRLDREYKNLSDIDVSKLNFEPVQFKNFSQEESRKIIFRRLNEDGEIHHETDLAISSADYSSVIGYFAATILKDLRLVTGYDILYGKLQTFIRDYLFGRTIDLEDMKTLRNLSEVAARRTILETLKQTINQLTIVDKGDARISGTIKMSRTKPFVVKHQGYTTASKSIFNKIVGDSHFELEFAAFLDKADDVISFVKNFLACQFKIDYRNHNGDISHYYPDFLVKTTDNIVYVVELKGQEDLDVRPKWDRLKQWCEDVNKNQSGQTFKPLFVRHSKFQRHIPKSFKDAIALGD